MINWLSADRPPEELDKIKQPVSVATPSEAPEELDKIKLPVSVATPSEARERTRLGLRHIRPAESGILIDEAPLGVYGFTHKSTLRDGNGELKRYPNGRLDCEIHKTKEGDVFVIGFVNEDTRVELEKDNDDSELDFTLYSDGWVEARHIARVPLKDVRFRMGRMIELDATSVLNAADLTLSRAE